MEKKIAFNLCLAVINSEFYNIFVKKEEKEWRQNYG